MKITKISLTAIVIMMAACSTSKKSTSTSSPAPVSETPLIFVMAPNGIHPPGNDELVAIQAQYQDVTLDKLKEGYTIYSQGACIKCHDAKNIYKRDEAGWKDIIDKMAVKAKISEEQKDAVYKYVLAIKATQPK